MKVKVKYLLVGAIFNTSFVMLFIGCINNTEKKSGFVLHKLLKSELKLEDIID